ncbi:MULTISPECIES: hypothetical protein [unclassified Nocardiopsis]|uniref:hypothetical protein n=1 Tax=Nocardiopsis TaxID=2013 RepID=UPI00387B2E55
MTGPIPVVVAGTLLLLVPFLMVKLGILDEDGKWSVRGLWQALKKAVEAIETTEKFVTYARRTYRMVSTLFIVPAHKS